MEKEILKVVKYFAFFTYAPSFEEIHTFLSLKTSKKHLQNTLDKMTRDKKLLTFIFKLRTAYYTLGEYSIFFKKKQIRTKNSLIKLKKINLYVKLLSFFPQIKLIGLSGTLAMLNASSKDDIDLFIITAKNRLWTGRFIAIFMASVLSLRRKRGDRQAKDKVCLNLFFEESDLHVPKFKKTEYVAHEILQMMPLVIKDDIYRRFLGANKWVFDLFPNAKKSLKFKVKSTKLEFENKQVLIFKIISWTEYVLKAIQLYFINKHKTNEIVTNTQLWFFPEDFEKKIGFFRFRDH